ncbi:hypothetical protein [Burkholderia sp. 22313]
MDFQPVGCCERRRQVVPGAGGLPVIDPGIDPVRWPEFYRIGD